MARFHPSDGWVTFRCVYTPRLLYLFLSIDIWALSISTFFNVHLSVQQLHSWLSAQEKQERACIHTKIPTWMFLEVSLVVAKNWGQPVSTADEQINCALSSSGHHSAVKSILLMKHQSQISEAGCLGQEARQEVTYCKVACTWDARKYKFIPSDRQQIPVSLGLGQQGDEQKDTSWKCSVSWLRG